MVSAELSENRKRPNKSQTNRGSSAGKKKCFWLGMEGLETAEGSSSESSDEDSEETASTSGMQFQLPPDGGAAVEQAAELHGGSQRAPVLAADTCSAGKQQSLATASGNGLSEDLDVEPGEVSAEKCTEKMIGETAKDLAEKKAGSQEPLAKETEAAPNPEKETREVTDEEGATWRTNREVGENVSAARPEESQSGNTVRLSFPGHDLESNQF